MVVYSGLVPEQLEVIQQKIMHASYNRTKFLSFFKHNDLIKNVGKGVINYKTTKWEKAPPGQVSRGFSDLPDSGPKQSQISTVLCDLATKVVIPVTDIHAWQSTNRVGEGDYMTKAINLQILSLTNQVDQFLAHGDDMKTPLGGDRNAAKGKFTGIFNGFTALAAGDGLDNDVSAAGDYMSTVAAYIRALKEAGFEADKYTVFSDVATWHGAQEGNNIYTSGRPVTELTIVKERPDIHNWFDTVNAQNASSESQIAVTTPRTSMGEPAYRLLQGYEFDVIPLYNGGLGNSGQLEMIVAWSGVIEEIHTTAIQRSAALSL